MNQGKTNKRMWFSLGLAVFLCIAALVISMGTTQARYRAEREETITFEVRSPEQICLGVVREATTEEAALDESLAAGELIFDPTTEPQWVTIDDVPRLTIAVANGISKTEFSSRDQRIRLRLIGSLGFWTGEATPRVDLRIPSEDTESGFTEVQAYVSPIAEGTTLYNTYGEGWILSFFEDEDEEVSWILEGGQLNYVTMTIVMENVVLSENSLLWPQIIAEVISK